MEAESRATSLEFEIREQVSRETDAELRKMEEMYLLALKRENEMINSRLNQQAQSKYLFVCVCMVYSNCVYYYR